MAWLEELMFLTSIYPVAQSWRANRATTLVYAMSWTAAAWLTWFFAVLLENHHHVGAIRYLALCLTACAAVAVLGARRPIAGAWNFVLLGLLAVLLLPLAENMVLGAPLLSPPRQAFVWAMLFVAVLNYLPTRFGPAALMLGMACAIEMLLLADIPEDRSHQSILRHLCHWLMPGAYWMAWFIRRRHDGSAAEFDRDWLALRDRFGLFWSQRVREQFNRAAMNAGWAVHLRWSGLRKTSREKAVTAADQVAIVGTMRGMLKRFGLGEEQ